MKGVLLIVRRCGATFSPELVRQWSEFTADANPLHTNAVYASGTPFGRPIVQGHLIASRVLDAIHREMGTRLYEGVRVTIRFTAPVGVGEPVEWCWDGVVPAFTLRYDDKDVVLVGIEAGTVEDEERKL